jgi:hypothetical protein
LLLVGKQFYYNGTSKKVALLYDLEKNDNVWVKKLPLENEFTGFSESFECNEHNDLYYVLGYRSILGYKRKYMNNGQLSVPVISYDSLFIYCMPAETRTNSRRKIDLRDSTGIKSISLIPSGSFINAIIHGNHYNEADEGRVFFLFQKFDRNLENGSVAKAVSLNDALVQKLTFYDGSDYKAAADKDYNRSGIYLNNDQAFILAGREEGTYSKELMLWTVNLQSGDFLSQQVVPRKIFFMPGNARYKHIGEVAGMIYKDQFFSFLLENRNNRNISAQEFRFQKFSRQRSIYGGNLAAYILKKDGNFEKKEIYRSLAYSFVPVKYQGTQGDFIFYLTNKGKKESFAILSLDLF